MLVDCPASVSATKDLISWIASVLPDGCIVKYFIATHAHGDHFLGLPVLQDTFADIKGIGTQSVVAGIAQQYEPPIYDQIWKPAFPYSESGTGLPATKAAFEPLPDSNELDLEGNIIKVYDVPHGDTHANSFVHVPALDLVVAGDIVYNGDCHQFLGEASTESKRKEWIQALAQIGALHPKIVVPGHTFTPILTPDETVATAMLEGTKAYIKGFEEELSRAKDSETLFQNMRRRYSRWNLYILSLGCQAAMIEK
jgi:glyoxylase-like metal-dependent hydrolase (beta-lactamase superfamily II)